MRAFVSETRATALALVPWNANPDACARDAARPKLCRGADVPFVLAAAARLWQCGLRNFKCMILFTVDCGSDAMDARMAMMPAAVSV